MKYAIPYVGSLRITRMHSKDNETRRGYRVHACDDRYGRVSTWITVPASWADDRDQVFAAAVEVVNDALSIAHTKDTGTEWGLIAEDVRAGEDSAARYADSRYPVHYRTTPYTLDSDGLTLATIGDAVRWARRSYDLGVFGPGSIIDLYPNDGDMPSHRLLVGARGGVRVERYG